MTATRGQSGAFYQLLTRSGPAGIAVVRACGTQVAMFAERHVRTRKPPAEWQRGELLRGALLNEAGEAIDDILVSVHAGEPVLDVRLHLHGSRWIVEHCCELLHAGGFSQHSVEQSPIWPARDAIDAEMHVLLPKMLTYRGVQWVARQAELLAETAERLLHEGSSDENRRICAAIADGYALVRWFVEPLRVVVAGPPNAGKSTLTNALADRQVSVVSPTPGTTRDWVEITGAIDEFPVTWIDTAGMRDGGDPIEAEGVRRTRELMQSADVVLWVSDAADAMPEEAALPERWLAQHGPAAVCVAANKCDLLADGADWRRVIPDQNQSDAAAVSALTGAGLNDLGRLLLRVGGRNAERLAAPAAFTVRQRELFRQAAQAEGAGAFAEALRACSEGPVFGR